MAKYISAGQLAKHRHYAQNPDDRNRLVSAIYGNIIVLPLEHAGQCGHMTDELSWLQQWFSAQCDGEWEHGFGITIETLDNPGWSVTICVEGTRLEFAQFEPVKTEISETDWIQCRVIERQKGLVHRSSPNYRRFEGFGGSLNLPDILKTFRTWAETRR